MITGTQKNFTDTLLSIKDMYIRKCLEDGKSQ